jgi:hypothetical protein
MKEMGMETREIIFEVRKISGEVKALREELERYKGFVAAWPGA